MGKPYALELEQMHHTYRWAMEISVDRLSKSLNAASTLPLIAVGSGGSFTTADFAAALHRDSTGKLANTMTPMEANLCSLDLRSTAAFLATAAGKNPDILATFRGLVVREPRRLVVFCTCVGSPLARLVAKYTNVDLVEVDLPCGRDGFLATNSLLASAILLARAYGDVLGTRTLLPSSLSALLGTNSQEQLAAELDHNTRPLWRRGTLVILYGPAVHSAAIDLESKFTEAALGNVQLADYRHFAHGRHHWLAKHPEITGILAFATPRDNDIASKTLNLIPANIPTHRLDVPFEGSAACIAALAWGFHIVGSAGRARGINPGRPGVPGFGRRIYHLKAPTEVCSSRALMSPDETAAVERKAGKTVDALARLGQLDFWRDAYARFTRGIAKASFRGIVLDYDGTVCDEVDRYTGLSIPVGHQLARLLRAGAMLGFATGRGRSVRQALWEQIPKKYRSQVIIGYYNGGEIARLDEEDRPDGSEQVADALRPVADAVQRHILLPRVAEFELRLPQIKVTPVPGASIELVWALLQEVVYGLGIQGVMVVGSGHSMDVLAPGVSKRAVVDRVLDALGCDEDSILSIGDRGQWPGNDFCLLNRPNALSVDEVSRDPATCWNLASPGLRGTSAALAYLGQFRPTKKGLRMTLQTRTRHNK